MKIKLSKSQWEKMGKEAGWTKEAGFQAPPAIDPKARQDYSNLIKQMFQTLDSIKSEIIRDENFAQQVGLGIGNLKYKFDEIIKEREKYDIPR